MTRVRIQKTRHPKITAIDGSVYTVDAAGVIEVPRRWPTYDPPNETEIRLAMDWLEHVRPIKTPTLNSYTAKHFVERWAGHCISNGSLIVAADRAGFRQLVGYDALNTVLGVSKRSLKRMSGARRSAEVAA